LSTTTTTTVLLHLFNGLFSKTTWVSQHQKGKPFWILLEQDDEVAVASAGPYAIHLHLAPVPHHPVFTSRMPFLPPNQQRQSTEGNILSDNKKLLC